MKFKTMLFLIMAILIMPYSVAAAEETNKTESVTKVKLIKSIKAKATDTVEAMFADLSSTAVQAGLDSARVFGHAKFKELGTGKYRITISWHTIGREVGSETMKRPLSPPLSSKFVTYFSSAQDKVEVGTILNAKGDITNAIKAFVTIGKDGPRGEGERSSLDQNQEDGKTKIPAASQAISGGSGGVASDNPTTNPTGGNNSNLHTTIKEPCPDRVDLVALSIFPMSKDVTRDQEGNVVSQSACTISGPAIPITKEYGGQCLPIYDFNNKKGHESYRLIAVVEGTTKEIQACQSDPARTFPLTETDVGCSVRQGFVNNVAVQQSRLIYTDNVSGQEVEARICQDSATTYAHFLTATGCQSIIDPIQNVWVIQKKVAYTNASGQIIEAAPCAPTADQVFEQYSQTLDHDFSTQQSYMLTRRYWFDGQVKTWLDDAPIRSTITYPHRYDEETCGYVHDDAMKRSQPQTVTFVDTSGDPLSKLGRQDLSVCQDYGQPVNYALQGTVWDIETDQHETVFYNPQYSELFKYPITADEKKAIENKLAATITQWPDGTTINTNGWSKDFTWHWGALTLSNTPPSTPIPQFEKRPKMIYTYSLTGSAERRTYVRVKKFLRPDRTVFTEPDSNSRNYNVAGGMTTRPASE